MATPTTRERTRDRANNKRERILEAAITVFAEKGFYEARVSEIAKAAGVADGTIYLYFKNKEDVLISVFREGIEALTQIVHGVAASSAPSEQKLREIVDLQVGELGAQRARAEVVTVNLRQSSVLLRQYAGPLFSKYLDAIGGVVAEGQHSGVFRADSPPRVVAQVIYGTLDALTLGWVLSNRDSASLRRAAHQAASILIDGLLVRNSAPEPKL